MKALTSFGETDDLERLRSQYGKVAGALADVFHEAEQAGLRIRRNLNGSARIVLPTTGMIL